jgi:four helix bundle protein
LDKIYELAKKLPASEKTNLRGQLERAVTSIVLNIAEGSTGQTDLEQSRFLGFALRSYIETVACLDIAERRNYLKPEDVDPVRQSGHTLFVKLQAFRRSVATRRRSSVSGPNND